MKRKIKVYQLFRRAFDSEGNLIPKEQRTNKILCIGTVLVPSNKKDFIEECIWDLFNWTCWGGARGKRYDGYLSAIRKGFRKDGYRCFPNSNARGYCNSDIFFQLEDKWRIAKSFGWDIADSYDEAVKKVIEQQHY